MMFSLGFIEGSKSAEGVCKSEGVPNPLGHRHLFEVQRLFELILGSLKTR